MDQYYIERHGLTHHYKKVQTCKNKSANTESWLCDLQAVEKSIDIDFLP